MKIASAFCALILGTSIASARLGETLDQCQARYAGLKKGDDGSYSAIVSGFFVFLNFADGKCSLIGYAKIQKDALGEPVAFTANEKQILLDGNFGAGNYTRQPVGINEQWIAKSGAMASYDFIKNIMFVATAKKITEEADKQKAAEAKKMGGL